MDWIKQNTFLATFGGIMLVGILGLGFFAFSSWKGYSAALDEFETTQSKLSDLENAPLHPNPENLKMVKTQVDTYEMAVDELFNKLKAAQPALPSDVDVTKFGEKIGAKLAPFQQKATDLGITIGSNFYMGMDRYRTEQPANDEEILQKLEWSLGGISVLANLTLDAGIETIDQFRRYEEPWENPAAAKPEDKPAPRQRGRSSRPSRSAPKPVPTVKMADVSEATRVRMRMTGTPDSITKFLNLVSNNEEYFFWIRWAKVANENARGPERDRTFAAIPVGDDPDADGDVPEPQPEIEVEIPDTGAEPALDADGQPVPAAPVVELPPAMIDVFPILGTERLRIDVVIDIVRFRDTPAPKEEEKKSSRR